MNKKLYIHILLFACLVTQLSAQRYKQRQENVIKIGLIEPFYSSFGVSYEKFIPETDISVQLHGSVLQRNIKIWENLTSKLSGFGVELQGRYYHSFKRHSVPSGIYNGLFIQYEQNKISMHIPEGVVNFLDGNSKFIGIIFGYQHGFGDHFFLDGTMGGGYHIADYSGRFSERGRVIPSLISSGFLPKFDVKMGVAF